MRLAQNHRAGLIHFMRTRHRLQMVKHQRILSSTCEFDPVCSQTLCKKSSKFFVVKWRHIIFVVK